jgi:hypothetical protein
MTNITDTVLMYRKRPLRAALVILFCCAAMSCNSCDCPEPRNVTKSQLSKREQPQPVAAADQLVVYLDASASMAGYVGNNPSAGTVYSRTLQELRNFVTLLNPPLTVFVRRVDTNVGAALNDMTLSRASADGRTFNGADTNLAGALDLFPQAVAAGQSGGGDLPPRFHILVTDGVQSTNQQQPSLNCAAGSDQLCVRRRILDLLNKGWGGCVIGLRSEFDGNIYSEVNRAGRRSGVIRYASVAEQPLSRRPFYLYIFSPDQAALEPFVTTLLKRLRPLVEGQDDALHVLPLTFQYTGGAAQAESSVPKSAASLLTVRKRQGSDVPEFTVAVDPTTAKKGPQPFTISVTVPWSQTVLDSGRAEELAQLVTWELTPVYPKAPESNTRYPEVKVVGQQVDDAGHILVQATAQWPPAVGKLCWRGYRLEGRLRPEASAPQWVREWSTDLDTTADTANKTLYLESALLGLWRNPILSNQLVAESSLVAGKR